MTGFDLTTVGEGGLRLSVPAGKRLRAADAFDVHPIGAELNVAGSLARLGWRTAWASGVNEGPIGDRIVDHATANGVDTSLVRRSPEGRTAVYYVEYGRAPLPTTVLYDRADSTFARLDPARLDWDRLLDTRLVHTTGITLGLGGRPRATATALVERARQAAVPVSVDVNYRANLWTPAEAADVLAPLLEGAAIVSCSAADAANLFGLDHPDPLSRVAELRRRFDAGVVLMSRGADGAVVLGAGDPMVTLTRAPELVDRLGAGDGMAAGALHAWLIGRPERMADYGMTGAGLALVQEGETLLTSAAELERLADQPSTDLER